MYCINLQILHHKSSIESDLDFPGALAGAVDVAVDWPWGATNLWNADVQVRGIAMPGWEVWPGDVWYTNVYYCILLLYAIVLHVHETF